MPTCHLKKERLMVEVPFDDPFDESGGGSGPLGQIWGPPGTRAAGGPVA